MPSEVSSELEQLAYQAKMAGQSGNWPLARHSWERALLLLPPASPEYAIVKSRIENIDAQMRVAGGPAEHTANPWKRWLLKLGPVGVLIWKLQTFLLLALTKGKLLLLGLTKLSTLTSMLLSLWVYCLLYGWKFALGLVLSIYVHEMGHVYQLRRYGIAATAPMFIPGFGALIRLRGYPSTPGQDARTGLAGPVWGTAAAIAAWCMALYTGAPIWYAIAHTGAWINLFNLIPIWQLDGGRGFRALTRMQRAVILGVALTLWAATSQAMLLLIAAGAGYRLISKDYAGRPDGGVMVKFGVLLAVLAALGVVTGGHLGR